MNIWDRFKSNITPRHPLGVWLNTRKLWTRAYIPARKDRVQLRGRRPFWMTFGHPVVIPANQWKELRQFCQSDFIWFASMVNTTVGGTAANPGVRLQIRILSSQPGKGKKLSITGVNDSNFAGTAQNPRYLRKPYRIHAGQTIVVRIQNLQNATNNVQFVMEGVQDDE